MVISPVVYVSPSGTSGMMAAMNGAVNFSTNDGWIPEFAKHGHNSYIVPLADERQAQEFVDEFDRENLMNVLENEILPTYYDNHKQWLAVVKNGMQEVAPFFDSNRMADDYYKKLYGAGVKAVGSR